MTPAAQKPGASFLIVSYHTAGLVAALVASIRRWVVRHESEILICDNSGDPAEGAMLRAVAGGNVRVFIQPDNPGFVRGTNLLASHARFGLLVLLNPDTLLEDGSLDDLLEYVAGHPRVGAAGPRLVNKDGSSQVAHYRFPSLHAVAREHFVLTRTNPHAYEHTPETPVPCDVVKGACMVLRRDVLGGGPIFDERYVMYSEEVDLCRRLHGQGLEVVFFPGARLLHYGEQSSRRADTNAYALWHYHRSRLLYFSLHGTPRQLMIVRVILVASLVQKSVLLGILGKHASARAHLDTLIRVLRSGWSRAGVLRPSERNTRDIRVRGGS